VPWTARTAQELADRSLVRTPVLLQGAPLAIPAEEPVSAVLRPTGALKVRDRGVVATDAALSGSVTVGVVKRQESWLCQTATSTPPTVRGNHGRSSCITAPLGAGQDRFSLGLVALGAGRLHSGVVCPRPVARQGAHAFEVLGAVPPVVVLTGGVRCVGIASTPVLLVGRPSRRSVAAVARVATVLPPPVLDLRRPYLERAPTRRARQFDKASLAVSATFGAHLRTSIRGATLPAVGAAREHVCAPIVAAVPDTEGVR
jgi:hypothetical protein